MAADGSYQHRSWYLPPAAVAAIFDWQPVVKHQKKGASWPEHLYTSKRPVNGYVRYYYGTEGGDERRGGRTVTVTGTTGPTGFTVDGKGPMRYVDVRAPMYGLAQKGGLQMRILGADEEGVTVQDLKTKETKKLSPEKFHGLMHEIFGKDYVKDVVAEGQRAAALVYKGVPRQSLQTPAANEKPEFINQRIRRVYHHLKSKLVQAQLSSASRGEIVDTVDSKGRPTRRGLEPSEAKTFVASVILRPGWTPDAKAVLLGSVAQMNDGRDVSRHLDIVVRHAEHLAHQRQPDRPIVHDREIVEALKWHDTRLKAHRAVHGGIPFRSSGTLTPGQLAQGQAGGPAPAGPRIKAPDVESLRAGEAMPVDPGLVAPPLQTPAEPTKVRSVLTPRTPGAVRIATPEAAAEPLPVAPVAPPPTKNKGGAPAGPRQGPTAAPTFSERRRQHNRKVQSALEEYQLANRQMKQSNPFSVQRAANARLAVQEAYTALHQYVEHHKANAQREGIRPPPDIHHEHFGTSPTKLKNALGADWKPHVLPTLPALPAADAPKKPAEDAAPAPAPTTPPKRGAADPHAWLTAAGLPETFDRDADDVAEQSTAFKAEHKAKYDRLAQWRIAAVQSRDSVRIANADRILVPLMNYFSGAHQLGVLHSQLSQQYAAGYPNPERRQEVIASNVRNAMQALAQDDPAALLPNHTAPAPLKTQETQPDRKIHPPWTSPTIKTFDEAVVALDGFDKHFAQEPLTTGERALWQRHIDAGKFERAAGALQGFANRRTAPAPEPEPEQPRLFGKLDAPGTFSTERLASLRQLAATFPPGKIRRTLLDSAIAHFVNAPGAEHIEDRVGRILNAFEKKEGAEEGQKLRSWIQSAVLSWHNGEPVTAGSAAAPAAAEPPAPPATAAPAEPPAPPATTVRHRSALTTDIHPVRLRQLATDPQMAASGVDRVLELLADKQDNDWSEKQFNNELTKYATALSAEHLGKTPSAREASLRQMAHMALQVAADAPEVLPEPPPPKAVEPSAVPPPAPTHDPEDVHELVRGGDMYLGMPDEDLQAHANSTDPVRQAAVQRYYAAAEVAHDQSLAALAQAHLKQPSDLSDDAFWLKVHTQDQADVDNYDRLLTAHPELQSVIETHQQAVRAHLQSVMDAHADQQAQPDVSALHAAAEAAGKQIGLTDDEIEQWQSTGPRNLWTALDILHGREAPTAAGDALQEVEGYVAQGRKTEQELQERTRPRQDALREEAKRWASGGDRGDEPHAFAARSLIAALRQHYDFSEGPVSAGTVRRLFKEEEESWLKDHATKEPDFQRPKAPTKTQQAKDPDALRKYNVAQKEYDDKRIEHHELREAWKKEGQRIKAAFSSSMREATQRDLEHLLGDTSVESTPALASEGSQKPKEVPPTGGDVGQPVGGASARPTSSRLRGEPTSVPGEKTEMASGLPLSVAKWRKQQRDSVWRMLEQSQYGAFGRVDQGGAIDLKGATPAHAEALKAQMALDYQLHLREKALRDKTVDAPSAASADRRMATLRQSMKTAGVPVPTAPWDGTAQEFAAERQRIKGLSREGRTTPSTAEIEHHRKAGNKAVVTALQHAASGNTQGIDDALTQQAQEVLKGDDTAPEEGVKALRAVANYHASHGHTPELAVHKARQVYQQLPEEKRYDNLETWLQNAADDPDAHVHADEAMDVRDKSPTSRLAAVRHWFGQVSGRLARSLKAGAAAMLLGLGIAASSAAPAEAAPEDRAVASVTEDAPAAVGWGALGALGVGAAGLGVGALRRRRREQEAKEGALRAFGATVASNLPHVLQRGDDLADHIAYAARIHDLDPADPATHAHVQEALQQHGKTWADVSKKPQPWKSAPAVAPPAAGATQGVAPPSAPGASPAGGPPKPRVAAPITARAPKPAVTHAAVQQAHEVLAQGIKGRIAERVTTLRATGTAADKDMADAIERAYVEADKQARAILAGGQTTMPAKPGAPVARPTAPAPPAAPAAPVTPPPTAPSAKHAAAAATEQKRLVQYLKAQHTLSGSEFKHADLMRMATRRLSQNKAQGRPTPPLTASQLVQALYAAGVVPKGGVPTAAKKPAPVGAGKAPVAAASTPAVTPTATPSAGDLTPEQHAENVAAMQRQEPLPQAVLSAAPGDTPEASPEEVARFAEAAKLLENVAQFGEDIDEWPEDAFFAARAQWVPDAKIPAGFSDAEQQQLRRIFEQREAGVLATKQSHDLRDQTGKGLTNEQLREGRVPAAAKYFAGRSSVFAVPAVPVASEHYADRGYFRRVEGGDDVQHITALLHAYADKFPAIRAILENAHIAHVGLSSRTPGAAGVPVGHRRLMVNPAHVAKVRAQPGILVHELGHLLQGQLHEDKWQQPHWSAPDRKAASAYGAVHPHESFAEAFVLLAAGTPEQQAAFHAHAPEQAKDVQEILDHWAARAAPEKLEDGVKAAEDAALGLAPAQAPTPSTGSLPAAPFVQATAPVRRPGTPQGPMVQATTPVRGTAGWGDAPATPTTGKLDSPAPAEALDGPDAWERHARRTVDDMRRLAVDGGHSDAIRRARNLRLNDAHGQADDELGKAHQKGHYAEILQRVQQYVDTVNKNPAHAQWLGGAGIEHQRALRAIATDAAQIKNEGWRMRGGAVGGEGHVQPAHTMSTAEEIKGLGVEQGQGYKALLERWQQKHDATQRAEDAALHT